MLADWRYRATQEANEWREAIIAIEQEARTPAAPSAELVALREALRESRRQWEGSHGILPGAAYLTLERAVRSALALLAEPAQEGSGDHRPAD
jgi:ferric-dicitrate binding protein FerR (iron transport regulator)